MNLQITRTIVITSVVVLLLFLGQSFQKRPQWIAPASADELKNPFSGDAVATTKGKTLFTQYCESCHGAKGKGDGIGGIALTPPPGNLVSQRVQSQTDGALFWKITEGNLPMASYKTSLSEEQRWQLVNYIRELGVNYGKKK